MDTQAATEDRESVSGHLGPDLLSKGQLSSERTENHPLPVCLKAL